MKMHTVNYYDPLRFIDRGTPLNKIFAISVLFILIGLMAKFFELAIVGGFVFLIFVVHVYVFAKGKIK